MHPARRAIIWLALVSIAALSAAGLSALASGEEDLALLETGLAATAFLTENDLEDMFLIALEESKRL